MKWSELKVSRRDFVKRTALSGAAAVAVGAGGAALPTSAWSADPSTSQIMGRTLNEAVRETRIIREADVVVVGGGPGGIGAALAAARGGADTVLIERYGHLGGMGTGGLVTIIPNMSNEHGKQQISGIVQEWVDRLEARNACDYPKKEHWGSTDPVLVEYYNHRSFFYAMGRVNYSVHIDAETSKLILDQMVQEAGIKMYFHSWGTEPIMDGNTVKGVIFESKSGRQAVLAKVVIDSTGDGDLLPYTGAEFEFGYPPGTRSGNLTVAFWIAGVDIVALDAYAKKYPEKLAQEQKELKELGGHPHWSFTSNIPNQEDLLWYHPRWGSDDQTDVEELTRVEIAGRERAFITYDYSKKHWPGFESSYVVLTSPQLGTRGSRRLVGEYYLTEKDIRSGAKFEDTIAVFPGRGVGAEIPYRTLIPRKVNGLLVACRAFSADAIANNAYNCIPHCIPFGQAAGTAAAMALDSNVDLRKVDIKALQARLKKQGAILEYRT
jgi:hypothetical protein